MQFSRYTGLAQGQVERNAVFRRHGRVRVGGEQKSRRRFARYMEVGGHLQRQLVIWMLAQQRCSRGSVSVFGTHGDDRVREDRKIRPAAEPVDRVHCGWVAAVKWRLDRRGQMTAGGESHEADSIGPNAELSSMCAHKADGTLSVLHLDGVVISGTYPIPQHERSNTHC